MGFAWAPANVRKFGMPEVWDYPPRSARHRKPRPERWPAVTAVARTAMTAASAMPRRAKAAVTTPALADHRRAF
jgi:hypothetical protein